MKFPFFLCFVVFFLLPFFTQVGIQTSLRYMRSGELEDSREQLGNEITSFSSTSPFPLLFLDLDANGFTVPATFVTDGTGGSILFPFSSFNSFAIIHNPPLFPIC